MSKSLIESYIQMKRPITEGVVDDFIKSHKCKTPGTIYHTEVHGNSITLKIDLPEKIKIPSSEKFQASLEASFHYALEDVLADMFFK